MGLEALELVERREMRVAVVEVDDEADRDLIVLEMVQERAAAGGVVERPAERVLHQSRPVPRRVDLPQLLDADPVFLRIAPLVEPEARDQLFGERAARTLGNSFKILAEVEFTGDSQGIIFSQGSRFGGYSFFIKGGKVVFVYNFLGISPEQRLACDAPSLGKHVVGLEFVKESLSKNLEMLGSAKLTVDGKEMGTAKFRTQSGHYALCGEGLCIGYDGGDAVSAEYQGKFAFSGGRIIRVVFDVAKDIHVDKARKMAAEAA